MTLREEIEKSADDAANEIDQLFRQRHTHREIVIAVNNRILAGIKLALEREPSTESCLLGLNAIDFWSLNMPSAINRTTVAETCYIAMTTQLLKELSES